MRWIAERRAERALLRDDEALVDRTLERLTAATLPGPAELLGQVESVRGFGLVKKAAVGDYVRNIAAAEKGFIARSEQPALSGPGDDSVKKIDLKAGASR